MPVKTVVIINDRSQPLGGATSLALLSARLLHEAGFRVVFVTGDDGGHCPLTGEIEVVPLNGRVLLDQSLMQGVRNGLFNQAAFQLVREVIAREDSPATVYHLHGWAQTLSPSVFQALMPVQDRLIVSAHDFSLVCPNGSYFNFQTEQVCPLKPLSPACLGTHCDKRKRADKVFRVLRIMNRQRLIDLTRTRALVALIHPSMADWMTRAGADPGRLRVLRNPVTPFCTRRVEAEKNADLFFIGRLQPEKGAVLAAQAARAAGRRLRLIGEGPDRAILEQAYPETILEGWLGHAEIAARIRDARALIMPSRLPEPFGLVALEALQSGVPLIAFSDSFVAHEAAGAGSAFLAADRSPVALGAAVSRLDDDELVASASHHAFNTCKDFSLTPESWRDGMIDLYAEQLARAPAREEVTA